MKKLIMVSLVLLFAAGTAAAQTCLDVAGATGCAPSPLDATEVTLSGVVYVQPGVYNSGSVYFACDAGGGMTFYDSAAPVVDGDHITVTGIVGAYYSQIQFASVSSLVVNSSGNTYMASPICTGDLADGSPMLGGFLCTQGVLAKVSDGFNSTYTLDDGTGPALIFVDGTTGIDTAALDLYLGDLVRISGASMCYNGEGELLPRSDADIELICIPNGDSSWGAVKALY